MRAGRMFDAKAGVMLTNQIILIRGGIIVDVGPNVLIPPGAKVIDLSGATVMPGLIDRHVHCFGGQENQALFDLPEFNKLYDEARKLPDSKERTQLFDRMTELVLAYAPWRMTVHFLEDQLLQEWVRDYMPHPIRSQVWQFVGIGKRPA